jgi:hypothetical protein
MMIWPCPTNPLAQDVAPVSPHGWLLLLAALLQQAPSAAKVQLLEQRGTLLLQLLYQVMLEGEGGHGRDLEDTTLAVTEEKRELIEAMLEHDDWQDSNSVSSNSVSYTLVMPKQARPVGLVLLILQSLFYEPVSASSLAESMPLQLGRIYKIGKVYGLGGFCGHLQLARQLF